MKIVQARPEDLDIVIRLRRQAAAWLAEQGQDQWVSDWPDTATMVAGFARDLQTGATWFAAVDDAVVGAVTVDNRTNAGLWTPEEAADALFVHRLTVDRSAAGQGIGARLLDVAGEQAQAAGRNWLRLDAWTTNTRLHRYYLRQGFHHVRTVADHFSPSAACFARPAAYRGGDHPVGVSGGKNDSNQE